MRSRNLKPGFFKNEDLLEIEPLGRLLFQGLWCMADREGRLEDRPKKIKIEVLPCDNCNVDKLLEILHKKGFILRYKINNIRFIQIINFKKHQSPHIKEQNSIIPEPTPNMYDACMVQASDINDTSPSDILIPSFLNPSKTFVPKRPKSILSETQEKWFNFFWDVYPRKQKKEDAKKAWGKIQPENGLCQTIIQAVKSQKQCEQWQKDKGQYIPMPATWLNGKRWEDEITTQGEDISWQAP